MSYDNFNIFAYSPTFKTVRDNLLVPKILEVIYYNPKCLFKEVSTKFRENSGFVVNSSLLFDKILNSLIDDYEYVTYSYILEKSELENYPEGKEIKGTEDNSKLESSFLVLTKDGEDILEEYRLDLKKMDDDCKSYLYSRFYSISEIECKGKIEIEDNQFEILYNIFLKFIHGLTINNLLKSSFVNDQNLKKKLLEMEDYRKYSEFSEENFKEFFSSDTKKMLTQDQQDILKIIFNDLIHFLDDSEKIQKILNYKIYNEIARLMLEETKVGNYLTIQLKKKRFCLDTNALIALTADSHVFHNDMFFFVNYLLKLNSENTNKLTEFKDQFNFIVFEETITEYKGVLEHSREVYNMLRLVPNFSLRQIQYFTDLPIFYIDFIEGKWNNWNQYEKYICDRFNLIINLCKETTEENNKKIKNANITECMEYVNKTIYFRRSKNPIQREHDIKILSKLIYLRMQEYKLEINDIKDPVSLVNKIESSDQDPEIQLIKEILENKIDLANFKSLELEKQRELIVKTFNADVIDNNNLITKLKKQDNKHSCFRFILKNRTMLERLFPDEIQKKITPSNQFPDYWLISFDTAFLTYSKLGKVRESLDSYPLCIGISALNRIMWPYLMTNILKKTAGYSRAYRKGTNLKSKLDADISFIRYSDFDDSTKERNLSRYRGDLLEGVNIFADFIKYDNLKDNEDKELIWRKSRYDS